MTFKTKRQSKTASKIPEWLRATDSQAMEKRKNTAPLERTIQLGGSEPRPEPRNTSPFPLPGRIRDSEAEPHPCPAQGFIEELGNKVISLSRQMDHIRVMHFRLVAELLRSWNLDQAALTWLDCDECRAELNALVDERQSERVH